MEMKRRREGIKERAVFSFYFPASAGGCFCEMIKKVLILERSCNDALLDSLTKFLHELFKLALGLDFKCFQGEEKVNFLLQGSAL